MNNKIQSVRNKILELSSAELFTHITSWQDTLQFERTGSLHTIYNYLLDMREFLQFLQEYSGDKPTTETLIEFDLSGFRAFLAHRVRVGHTAQSNRRLLSALRNFYLYLQKKTGLKSNHIDEITSPKLSKHLPKALPYQQVKMINNLSILYTNQPKWVQARDESLLMLLYGCGLRISEALSLNINDMNTDILRIQGKRNKERLVPLLPIVQERVRQYLKIRPGNNENHSPLFIGIKGDRLHARMVQKAMERIRLAFGLPESATPHSLRHSYASHLLSGGADLRSIQELLGHDSLASTQVYTKLEDQALIETYMKSHPRAKITSGNQ